MGVWIAERIEFAGETPLQSRVWRERERGGFAVSRRRERGEEEGKVLGRKEGTVEILGRGKIDGGDYKVYLVLRFQKD